jgi:hypothetical protein
MFFRHSVLQRRLHLKGSTHTTAPPSCCSREFTRSRLVHLAAFAFFCYQNKEVTNKDLNPGQMPGALTTELPSLGSDRP